VTPDDVKTIVNRIMPKQGKDTAVALKLADTLLHADGTPGTVLLLTDGVEPDAAESIGRRVVILGIGTAQGGLDLDALRNVAAEAGVPLATMTDDEADVRWIARQVQTNFTTAKAASVDRWLDAGWYLLFPITILFALSFRRGWVVKVASMLLATHLLSPAPADAASFLDIWLTPDQQGRFAFDRGNCNGFDGFPRSDVERSGALSRWPLQAGIGIIRIGCHAASALQPRQRPTSAW